MEYLNGKNLQKKRLADIKKMVTLLEIKPVLAVISVDFDQVGTIFFKQIKNMCEEVGYGLKHYHYEDISKETLVKKIQKLNQAPEITAILILKPLPKHLSFLDIGNVILPQKDVEGISDVNRMKVLRGEGSFLPAVVLGIIQLLEGYSIDVFQKEVVILNRRDDLGQSIAPFFLQKDCTVTICHSKTRSLEHYLKNADIVITAVGKANFLSSQKFKKGSVIIDVGLEYFKGKLCGDIELIEEGETISYLAKSIGGVGPMTIAALAENILKSYYLTQECRWKIEF